MASSSQAVFHPNFSFDPSRRTHHNHYQASVSPFTIPAGTPSVSQADLSLLAQQFGQQTLVQQRVYQAVASTNHATHSYSQVSSHAQSQYAHSQQCVHARSTRQPVPFGQCLACTAVSYQSTQARQPNDRGAESMQTDEGFDEPGEDDYNTEVHRLAYRRSTDFTGSGRVSRPIRRRKKSRLGQE